MRTNLMILLVATIFSLSGELAMAQFSGPSTLFAPRARRPTLSPYLNLLNDNNTDAFNYYSRVRPQEALSDYRNLQAQSLKGLQKEIDKTNLHLLQNENSALSPSGHHARFLDLGGYFGSSSGQRGGGGIGRR